MNGSYTYYVYLKINPSFVLFQELNFADGLLKTKTNVEIESDIGLD